MYLSSPTPPPTKLRTKLDEIPPKSDPDIVTTGMEDDKPSSDSNAGGYISFIDLIVKLSSKEYSWTIGTCDPGT